jgi:hypothetical protein
VAWRAFFGDIKCGQVAAKHLARAYPNAVLMHTPVHASRLSRVECFFSTATGPEETTHRQEEDRYHPPARLINP